MISQLRSYSSKRILNKIGELEEADFNKIRERTIKMIEKNLSLPLS